MKTVEQLAKEYADKEYTYNADVMIHVAFVKKDIQTAFLAGYNAREQWISVEDGLPEITKQYEVVDASDDILYFDGKTTKKGWMTRVRYTDKEFKYGDIYFTSLSDIKCKTVTHWMPLPNAPKP